jgi:hypothetical protein
VDGQNLVGVGVDKEVCAADSGQARAVIFKADRFRVRQVSFYNCLVINGMAAQYGKGVMMFGGYDF